MNKHIIFLHGALGTKDHFSQLEKELSGYTVHSFNFLGHGGNSFPENMNMQAFVFQLANYISVNIPGDSHLTIFGYSMGGYAALLLASEKTHKIDKIITLGTKIKWNPEISQKEIQMLNPSVIEEKLPAFAKELEVRHHPQDWKTLLSKTSEMMIDLGNNNYLSPSVLSTIDCDCKIMLGDKDKMVSLEETVEAFKAIKNSSLAILPSTLHPIEKVNIQRLVFEIEN